MTLAVLQTSSGQPSQPVTANGGSGDERFRVCGIAEARDRQSEPDFLY
jgi:hypothetical protein